MNSPLLQNGNAVRGFPPAAARDPERPAPPPATAPNPERAFPPETAGAAERASPLSATARAVERPAPPPAAARDPERPAPPPATARDPAPPADLDALVNSITAVEAIVAGWPEPQILTVQALKSAIEDLHKEALKRLIRALKDDPAAGARLRAALADPVIYAVLRFHGLVKAPLAERLNLALEEVRPALAGHGGGVELVEIKPPDTVELRLIGSCHGCPASGQTLTEGVEKAIRAHCPEILHIHQVSRAAPESHSGNSTRQSTDAEHRQRAGFTPDSRSDGAATLHFISPFAININAGWLDAAALAEIPEGGIAERKLKGRSVLLAKHGLQVSCFDNACAHLGMPLEMGEINDGTITCSYHGFRYLLETGECLTAPEVQLKVHAVRVTGDRIQVRLEDG
jgi:nitrite reductase/ring-hydroxylating ferredoxin subunit/Fe-S cluster biogenesis protein NfuA